jgi:acyl-CoA reductase-like NAD-dependent aldehyde dehydrogenase
MMMGRPIKYTPKEITTTVLRGRYMISIAERELSDVDVEVGNTPVKGLKRFIRKEPVGVVLTISGIPFDVIVNNSLELSLVVPFILITDIVLLLLIQFFLLY